MAPRTYSRVYHEIVTHPRFSKVYANPSALGTWLRMLLTADAMYPMPAPMPPRTPTVRMLIASGLVMELPGGHYTMRGLEAEREYRSAIGRNANAVRWDSKRSPDGLLAEKRIEEKSKSPNGQQEPGTFMGFRPRSLSTHDGRHGTDCLVCYPENRKDTTA